MFVCSGCRQAVADCLCGGGPYEPRQLDSGEAWLLAPPTNLLGAWPEFPTANFAPTTAEAVVNSTTTAVAVVGGTEIATQLVAAAHDASEQALAIARFRAVASVRAAVIRQAQSELISAIGNSQTNEAQTIQEATQEIEEGWARIMRIVGETSEALQSRRLTAFYADGADSASR
jgi:hypothetical protein